INAENVTTATVVPTMLDRIVSVLENGGGAAIELPSLRNLAYGGSKVGLPLVRRALELLPDVGFVNAYGLTETSSTIAVLTLDENGWFPTKDIAILDDEGYLFIGGRSDDTIIRGGENIAPAELEEVLFEHPHVRDVAVVGVEDPQWGQAIVAVVVPATGVDPD